MSDYFDQIIEQSKHIYDMYREEYRRFNRLMIGFSAGAITFLGSMLAPSAGRVPWFMTTGLLLYLLSIWLGLVIEYTCLTRLEKKLKKLTEVTPSDPPPLGYDDEYMEIPYSFSQALSRDFPAWKLHSQIIAFFLASVSVLLDFLLPSNADVLDILKFVFWGIGVAGVTMVLGVLFSNRRELTKPSPLPLDKDDEE